MRLRKLFLEKQVLVFFFRAKFECCPCANLSVPLQVQPAGITHHNAGKGWGGCQKKKGKKGSRNKIAQNDRSYLTHPMI